jgi:hypothetical protein
MRGGRWRALSPTPQAASPARRSGTSHANAKKSAMKKTAIEIFETKKSAAKNHPQKIRDEISATHFLLFTF